MKASEIPSLFGDPCASANLRNLYSNAFGRFLSGPDVNGTARLVACYVSEIADLVVFEIDTVLPQHPFAEILETELIACRFFNQKDCRPDVLALREDFPRLPHQNLGRLGEAKSLCLDTTSWDEAKFQWKPSGFLEAIRGWLAKAASGTLHARGQPREPLMAAPGGYLILPPDADLYSSEKLIIEGNFDIKPVIMWARDGKGEKVPGRGKFRVICFQTPDREHGIIEFRPQNMRELEQLCERGNFDLRQALTENLRKGAIDGDLQGEEYSFNILLVLHHQVTGREDPGLVGHEEWAFMIGEVGVLGKALGVVDSLEGRYLPLMGAIVPSEEKIGKIEILPVGLFKRLNESRALTSSGLKNPYPPVAVIGVGSLGSKVLEILVRQGLGNASLVDEDFLLPHNTARHSLTGRAVGYKKTMAFSQYLAGIHDHDGVQDLSAFPSIEESFSKTTSDELNAALACAGFVLDFSASVSVSRELAARNDVPRCFCAFLTPGADTLIVHQEDDSRTIRLDWLEVISLRAIYENPKLRHAYTRNSAEIWYGGPCRAVSTVLPNQNVSLFSAACAGFFTNHHHSPQARCMAFCLDADTMALEVIEVEATKPYVVESNGWTVRFDGVLVASMKGMRALDLPNETGGVILGVFDREREICSAVIASHSPSDSKAWPEGYIRGADGLEKFVEEARNLTANQLQYVGEWHSHPRNCPTAPSNTDREALRILCAAMGREGLPAVMFIVGDDPQLSVSVGWQVP